MFIDRLKSNKKRFHFFFVKILWLKDVCWVDFFDILKAVVYVGMNLGTNSIVQRFKFILLKYNI